MSKTMQQLFEEYLEEEKRNGLSHSGYSTAVDNILFRYFVAGFVAGNQNLVEEVQES